MDSENNNWAVKAITDDFIRQEREWLLQRLDAWRESCPIYSELAELWDTPEEDEAWRDL